MKRTTRKTLFVFVLIAAMMLSIFPAAAFAEGAAAAEPAAQTEQQPETNAASAEKDDGETKADTAKGDVKPAVADGKTGEEKKDESEAKDAEEESVEKEEKTGDVLKTPKKEAGGEENAPAVSDAVRAFLAAASAFTMPEDVKALTDEECQTLAAQINDLFVMYSQLSEEDRALPEVQTVAAALEAAYGALDGNTEEVLLSATQANTPYNSVPLALHVSGNYYSPSTGGHTVKGYDATKYIKRTDACSGNDINASGSATARFVGSNETGWTLYIDVVVGNYKATWTTNAKIYNKDMSKATGSVTFGMSWDTSRGTSTSIWIDGAKDLVNATLKYDGNGGTDTVTDVPNSESKSGPKGSSATFTVSSITPTRKNYTFKGWNTDPSGNGTAYEAGKTISVAYGSTTTLYAQWDEDKQDATLKFDPNAGTDYVANMPQPNPMTRQPEEGKTTVSFPIPTNIPVRDGYEFQGWNTKADETGDSYDRGGTVENVPVGTTVTLYAIWGEENPPERYATDLIYDANADDATNVDPAVDTKYVALGEKAQFTVTSDKPVRAGYTFAGWNTDKDGNGTSYDGGATVEVDAGTSETLYAQWKTEEVVPVDWNGLGISKTVSPAGPVKPGTILTYTITVTNNTGVNLDSVDVYDKLDKQLTFVSATGAGIYDKTTYFWNVGALANGASATLVITATVKFDTADKTVISNTASIFAASAGGESLAAGSGPSASATVTVVTVDWNGLGISKTVSPAGPVKPGTTLTYTITVTNNTGVDISSVVVYDKLDRHLTFVSATGAGIYDKTTYFWNVGALANGASATLVITATVNAGTADKTVISNTASIFAASAGRESLKAGSGPSASANVAVTNPGGTSWGGTTWGKGVQTGDDANLGLWISAMIVSFLCAAALVYVNRKRIFKGKANK